MLDVAGSGLARLVQVVLADCAAVRADLLAFRPANLLHQLPRLSFLAEVLRESAEVEFHKTYGRPSGCMCQVHNRDPETQHVAAGHPPLTRGRIGAAGQVGAGGTGGLLDRGHSARSW